MGNRLRVSMGPLESANPVLPGLADFFYDNTRPYPRGGTPNYSRGTGSNKLMALTGRELSKSLSAASPPPGFSKVPGRNKGRPSAAPKTRSKSARNAPSLIHRAIPCLIGLLASQ